MADCIIFGGDGFIGSNLTDELFSQGHRVTIFTRRETNVALNEHPDLTYFYGDFLNLHDIDDAVAGHEYVFHLVSLTNPAVSEEDPFIDIETNVKMSIHLLESCVKHKIKRVIYTSSGGSIYGNPENNPISESDPTNPISPYAIGKQTIEGYLRYFHNKYRLDYRTLRISNVYGSGQNTTNNKHGVVSVFLHRIIDGEPIQIYGDGSMVRDYLEVHDLVSYMAGMFEKKSKFKLYNIGSGEGVTVNDILESIEKVIGKKAKVTYSDAPSSYVKSIVLDCKRAEREFGPIARTSLTRGIEKMVQS